MGIIKTKEYHNYCDTSETICDQYIAEISGTTKWFTSLSKNEKFSKIDYDFIDKKGKEGKLEIKNREIPIDKYPDIMIEPSKFDELYSYTGTSLYWNFMENDKNRIWVVDIHSLNKDELNCKGVRIKSKVGEQFNKFETRLFIPTEQGHYYQITNNRIKKIF